VVVNGNTYSYTWQTKGLPAGSYTILVTLAGDTMHPITVQLTTTGKPAGLMTNSADGTAVAAGALLGGDIELYVDNSNGDLTADELARIQDAVTAVDAVTEAYGVKVGEVTDASQADVTLTLDSTSAVGGYADGVLGCTTDAGEITLIEGWNYYAGSDATQIGAGQYDFQTVVTHELGHALGLGHSSDATSVMYASLASGTARRALTVTDLNVPDTDADGACGLHADLLPSVVAGSNDPSREIPNPKSQIPNPKIRLGFRIWDLGFRSVPLRPLTSGPPRTHSPRPGAWSPQPASGSRRPADRLPPTG